MGRFTEKRLFFTVYKRRNELLNKFYANSMSFKRNFDKNRLTCYHHAKRTLPTVSTRKFTAIHKFKGENARENVTFANL